ncbi:hypothetical protein M569_06954, partial [Genlisea aurea]
RREQLQAFDDTKSGVKGLVDAGITTLPEIFIRPPDATTRDISVSTAATLPVIDLTGVENDPSIRARVVDEIRSASEAWGFFQVVNHGVPASILTEMVDGVRKFNEQEIEIKKKYYSRDFSKGFRFNTNFDFFTAPFSTWRDSFYYTVSPNPPPPEELPAICRDVLREYSEEVMKLGKFLLELLSESLGLKPHRISETECAHSLFLVGHYYPPCPQPNLTLGVAKHSDNNFITVLLQDSSGGLQIIHDDQWVDVPPVPGAFIVNIGDLMQLITNDKLRSIEHRVLASEKGPRVSIASFFGRSCGPSFKLLAPIEELLSEANPAKYRATTADEYTAYFVAKGLDGTTSALNHFRI